MVFFVPPNTVLKAHSVEFFSHLDTHTHTNSAIPKRIFKQLEYGDTAQNLSKIRSKYYMTFAGKYAQPKFDQAALISKACTRKCLLKGLRIF